MAEIKGKFNWRMPEVCTSFIHGTDAQAVYNSLGENMKSAVSYDPKTELLTGSNVFAAARIDTLLKPLGIRVANLRDLSRPEVIEMVAGKHYTDAPALILRSMEDSNPRNLPLIRQLTRDVKRVNGNVQLPVLITGFDVTATEGDKDGYGLVIVPRGDFKAVYDGRLSREHDCKKFTDVDELGLPKFYADGKRTWYARDSGLSRLYLGRYLDLDSGDDDLADSIGYGRVVVVGGVATAKNLVERL